MPLNRRGSAKPLAPMNEEELHTWASKKLADTPYYALLRLLAASFDEIARGNNVYSVIGSTKDASSYTFTLNDDGDRTALFATSLADLGGPANDLLEPS